MTRWKGKPGSGSRAFSPRKRASSQTCRIRSWPSNITSENPTFLAGFAGYKAGMTHCFVVDGQKHSNSKGKEIMLPCTVLETPPLVLFGVRSYKKTPYGLSVLSETYSNNPNKYLLDRIRPGKENKNFAQESAEADEIRGLFHTQPYKIKGVPKKIPDVVELQLLGSNEEKIKYAEEKIGKEIPASEIFSSGQKVDAFAVTKGKGTQGAVKRFGVKIMKRKQGSLKGRRGGTSGGRQTGVRWQVPMPGQTGYQQRCDLNKRVLVVNGDDVNPAGGFVNYGVVGNDYLLIEGSVPGPVKRLITLRHALRPPSTYDTKPEELTYLSKDSKQG